jgi:hypothetical protein
MVGVCPRAWPPWSARPAPGLYLGLSSPMVWCASEPDRRCLNGWQRDGPSGGPCPGQHDGDGGRGQRRAEGDQGDLPARHAGGGSGSGRREHRPEAAELKSAYRLRDPDFRRGRSRDGGGIGQQADGDGGQGRGEPAQAGEGPMRRYLTAMSLLADGASVTHAAHAAGVADSAHLTRTAVQMNRFTPTKMPFRMWLTNCR